MDSSVAELTRRLRRLADLSQRDLARLAGTSQPAIARYESGRTTPSPETLTRLATACGFRLRIDAEPAADPGDLGLAEELLELTPRARLRSLRNYARIRGLVEGG